MTSDDRWTYGHLIIGFALAVTAIAALMCGWAVLVSGGAVVLLDFYLLAILIEVGVRSGQPRTYSQCAPLPKPKKFMELPGRALSLLQIVFLLSSVVAGFGNLFLRAQCGVVRTTEEATLASDTPVAADSAELGKCGITRPILHSKVDAAYYSAVTLATLGYGDFVPARKWTRVVVMWELLTGILLLTAAFPLLVSRLADF
jgi:hypothetical protein